MFISFGSSEVSETETISVFFNRLNISIDRRKWSARESILIKQIETGLRLCKKKFTVAAFSEYEGADSTRIHILRSISINDPEGSPVDIIHAIHNLIVIRLLLGYSVEEQELLLMMKMQGFKWEEIPFWKPVSFT
jgi:hypothetical protein